MGSLRRGSLWRRRRGGSPVSRSIVLLVFPVFVAGCFPQRPPLTPEHARTVDAVIAEWRESGMPWHEGCDHMRGRITVDREIERCYGRVWACQEDDRIHVSPEIEQARGPESFLNAVVHEMSHVMIGCSHIDPYGDPGHMYPGVWETEVHGFVRRSQSRARQ